MKRLLVKIISIVFLINNCLYSNLFQSNYSIQTHSFFLFSNPSLLVDQTGIPISTSLKIHNGTDNVYFKAALIKLYLNNAFSIGYENDSSIKNSIVTGYAFKKEFFNFGSSFSFLLDAHSAPGLVLDVATTIKTRKANSYSLIFDNILSTDTLYKIINPKITLSSFGPFPGIGKYLGYEISYFSTIFEYENLLLGHGGNFLLCITIPVNPLIYVTGGYQILSNKIKELEQNISLKFGMQIDINELSTGLEYSCEYDINKSGYRMHLSLNFNPTLHARKQVPEIDVKVIPGSELNPGLYVAIRCLDFGRDTKLKKWILVFSTKPSTDGSVIKSFSGGNIPPSTIYWDLRDSKGKYHDSEIIYLRAVLTDDQNNITSTPWIPFDPKIK